MDAGNYVGAGDVKNLVATLVSLKFLKGWAGLLNHGSHGAIGHNDSRANGID
jgi:hypothetical protein